jgi:hypothetical protein
MSKDALRMQVERRTLSPEMGEVGRVYVSGTLPPTTTSATFILKERSSPTRS